MGEDGRRSPYLFFYGPDGRRSRTPSPRLNTRANYMDRSPYGFRPRDLDSNYSSDSSTRTRKSDTGKHKLQNFPRTEQMLSVDRIRDHAYRDRHTGSGSAGYSSPRMGSPYLSGKDVHDKRNENLYPTWHPQIPDMYAGSLYDDSSMYDAFPPESGRPRRKKTVRSVLREFAQLTSFQGVPYIYKSNRWWSTTFWVLVFMAAVGMGLYQLHSLFVKFYRHDYSTVVDLGYDALEFPSVTVCNQNPVKMNLLKAAHPELHTFLKEMTPPSDIDDMHKPGTNDKGGPQPGATGSQPGTGGPQPGTGTPQPGTGGTQPGTSGSQPGTTGSRPGTTGSRPGTTGSQPGTAGSRPGPSGSQPGTSGSQPGTTESQPGTTGSHPGTTESQPGTTGSQPGTTGSRPGTSGSRPGPSGSQPGRGSRPSGGRGKREARPPLPGVPLGKLPAGGPPAKNSYRRVSDKLTEFEVVRKKYLQMYGEISLEDRQKIGHPGDEFILRCSYEGHECSHLNFSHSLSPTHGNCYTFNSAKLQERPIRSYSSGKEYGLELTLFLDSFRYLPGITQGLGAILSIHQFNTMPFPDLSGLSVSSGMETSYGIQLVNISRLSTPYGNCTQPEELRSSHGVIYTKEACLQTCAYEFLASSCGCYQAPYEVYYTNETLNTLPRCLEEDVLCLESAWTHIYEGRDGCISQCHAPCNEQAHAIQGSSHVWPQRSYNYHMINTICKSNQEACGLMQQDVAQSVRDNLALLRVYYRDLNFENITQIPDYESATFASDIGGTLGLWLGVSVLSGVELLQLLVNIIYFLVRKRCRRNRQNTNKADSEHNRNLDNIHQGKV